MGNWITGDIHVHSACDHDAVVPVAEIVAQSRQYVDFLAISGHARRSDNWGLEQHEAVVEARGLFPDVPIFHTAEIEFPIPRHAMVLTCPCDREVELQQELVRRFDRLAGHEGPDAATELMRYVEANWPGRALLVLNHPNSPDVPFEHLEVLARSNLFKILACYDRGHRRAPQTWDVGAEWDRLLMQGRRVWVRFGSDFHNHFTNGGRDYYPGEFVQDQLLVEANSYKGILDAYRSGSYFCTVDRIISELTLKLTQGRLAVSFVANEPVAAFEVISDGRVIMTVDDVGERFERALEVAPGRYYRLRGFGRQKDGRYGVQPYVPVFLSNPVFAEDAS